jgi:hypothetical protein
VLYRFEEDLQEAGYHALAISEGTPPIPAILADFAEWWCSTLASSTACLLCIERAYRPIALSARCFYPFYPFYPIFF